VPCLSYTVHTQLRMRFCACSPLLAGQAEAHVHVRLVGGPVGHGGGLALQRQNLHGRGPWMDEGGWGAGGQVGGGTGGGCKAGVQGFQWQVGLVGGLTALSSAEQPVQALRRTVQCVSHCAAQLNRGLPLIKQRHC